MRRRMCRRWGAPLVLLIMGLGVPGCAFIVADLNPFGGRPQALEEQVVEGERGPKILLLDVSGVISAEDREETLGLRHKESSVARVAAELKQATDDDDIKALIVRINSPGGTVTASDILYHEIRSFAEKQHVPVVAQIMDVGASGGYYTALAADEIVAHPTSVTGSIGVIMMGLNLEGLLDKLGVRDQTLKAGEHKDIGSPLRQMTAEEHRILQTVLDDMRGRFVDLVRERRPKADSDTLAAATDGRILTASQALQAGLIDHIGYLEDATALARRRAGVDEARVILYRRPDELSENIYSRAGAPVPQVNLINVDLGALTQRGPAFMYLWVPGGAE